ncbi:MAG TPA: hypothetical protein VJ911_10875, partial [Cryomorphaceae bacterium]|nr:hypothetical protein [Cryomorphaceae bacterium]
TVMRDSGVAIMGQATAEGEDRAITAAKEALESPLLNDNDIEGAKYILLNITYGTNEVMMDEISDITDFIQQAAGDSANVIWGHGMDESLGEKLSVTIIATGFKTSPDTGFDMSRPVKMELEPDKSAKKSTPITGPISNPVGDEPFLKENDTNTEKAEEPKREPEEVEKFDLFDEQPEPELETPKVNKAPESENKSEPEKKDYFDLDIEEEEGESVNIQQAPPAQRVNPEAVSELNKERLRNLREISERIKSPEGLTELEKEPAYKRRNVRLENVQHSSDSDVSRYTLTQDKDDQRKSGLRPNNPYLHDNVD